jgi:hypothetical protein
MPRQKGAYTKDQVKELLTYIYQSFGKPLMHSVECEQLSIDIEKVTGAKVSPNTLRRVLGFLSSEFSPSLKTLDALAAYAGFANWYSFISHDNHKKYQPLTLDQEASLYLSIYQIDMTDEADMNYHNACRNIALRIVSNEALLSKLSPFLARNPVSQIYFFERFPFIDGLCGEYKRSLHLYLQKKTTEAKIFGNSLLLFSAFLCGKHKEVKFYCEKLKSSRPQESMHPFLIARYIGSQILDKKIKKDSIDKCLEDADHWNRFFLFKENKGFWQFPYFPFMMADYLNLAGYYDEAYGIIRTIRNHDKEFEIEKGYLETLDVITHIARHKVSPDDYITWIKETSSLDNTSPFSRKFYQLQALCVYRSLLKEGKKKQVLTSKINDLVKQTGFTNFFV